MSLHPISHICSDSWHQEAPHCSCPCLLGQWHFSLLVTDIVCFLSRSSHESFLQCAQHTPKKASCWQVSPFCLLGQDHLNNVTTNWVLLVVRPWGRGGEVLQSSTCSNSHPYTCCRNPSRMHLGNLIPILMCIGQAVGVYWALSLQGIACSSDNPSPPQQLPDCTADHFAAFLLLVSGSIWIFQGWLSCFLLWNRLISLNSTLEYETDVNCKGNAVPRCVQ